MCLPSAAGGVTVRSMHGVGVTSWMRWGGSAVLCVSCVYPALEVREAPDSSGNGGTTTSDHSNAGARTEGGTGNVSGWHQGGALDSTGGIAGAQGEAGADGGAFNQAGDAPGGLPSSAGGGGASSLGGQAGSSGSGTQGGNAGKSSGGGGGAGATAGNGAGGSRAGGAGASGTGGGPSNCVIASVLYSAGDRNPAEPCLECAPTQSASAWSRRGEGTSCDSNKVCHVGACQSACWIDATYYGSGAENPNNPCQSCQPTTSVSAWSSVPTSHCATAIAASGNGSSCAVVNGAVYCWGDNTYGNLGNNTGMSSVVPVQVQGLTTGVLGVTAGVQQTCARLANGNYCWGGNSSGQLGNNSTASSAVPVVITGFASGLTDISAGTVSSCAIFNGAGYCWGGNGSGQLGIGTTASQSLVPVNVSGGLTSRVTSISMGYLHACAMFDALPLCWGSNSDGELGDGTTNFSNSPVQAQRPNAAGTAITAGTHFTCGLFGGAAYCWGANSNGQIGVNATGDQKTPVQVTGLTSGVTAISAGGFHACAIANGAAYCWGYNDGGRLGNGTTTASKVPVPVQGFTSGVTAISAGYYHTCAIRNGRAYCWGPNRVGELGNNSTTDSSAPVLVQFP